MTILQRLIANQEKLFIVNRLFDFIYPDNLNIHREELSDLKNESIKEIINLLIEHKGKEIKYFKFKIGDDNCVLIFSCPFSKSGNISDIDSYPSIHSFTHYNYHTRCTDSNTGAETFHDFHGNIVETPLLKVHYRILICIRLINSLEPAQSEALIYSFKGIRMDEKEVQGKESDYFSMIFEADLNEKVQKVVLFTAKDQHFIIKNLRIVPTRKYHWVTVKKQTETTYEVGSYYSRTSGSNNWDIDTTTKGVFNIFSDKWEHFEQNEEHYKN